MLIYQFVSHIATKRAFTSDSTGANLPDEWAPWSLRSDCGGVSFEEDDGPVASLVHREGLFLLGGVAEGSILAHDGAGVRFRKSPEGDRNRTSKNGRKIIPPARSR
jgi:hypothetical protein